MIFFLEFSERFKFKKFELQISGSMEPELQMPTLDKKPKKIATLSLN
jgi:hypothetical protein